MKKGYLIAIVLLIVTWAFTAAMLMILPDTVPAHYNAAGEVDRFGSKYEQLILPLFITALAATFMASSHKKTIYGEKRSLMRTCIIMQTVLLVLFVYLALKALTYADSNVHLFDDVWRFLAAFMGVTIAVIATVVREVPRNRMFGLRTRWSLSSDAVWRKSQRFAGVSGVVAGCLMLLCACVFKGVAAGIIAISLLVLWAVLGVMASYRFAKSEEQ